jgi:hypothetical protein
VSTFVLRRVPDELEELGGRCGLVPLLHEASPSMRLVLERP